MIRFRFSYRKAIEVLVWLAHESPGLDIYHVVKVLFYADKDHLQTYGRPILGDRYVALNHGPVPSNVYYMLRGDDPAFPPEQMHSLHEAVRIGENESGHRALFPLQEGEPRLEHLSDTDRQCLTRSVEQYGSMSFEGLRQLTHRERAYERTDLNSEIDYELMIDEDVEGRDELVDHLREIAGHAVF